MLSFRPGFSPTCASERIPRSVNLLRRPEENLQVQPEAPVGDVPEVQFNPPLHKADRRRLAAKPVNLGPSGNPRLHMLAVRIIRDQAAILSVMRKRMWPRSNE